MTAPGFFFHIHCHRNIETPAIPGDQGVDVFPSTGCFGQNR